ncbi:hypothetical protein FJZ36_04025 [Candidatus Poribacteria bacterium]|nr:hypothetical protein [Candidatus Poribacteria bacterium]
MLARRLFPVLLAACAVLIGCAAKSLPTPSESAAIAAIRSLQPSDFLESAVVGPQGDGTYVVATTQIVAPAGTTVEFPGRPTDLALHPSEPILAVKNRSDVVFFDTMTHAIVQTLAIPGAGGSFTGIEWDRDGKRVWTTDTRGFLRAAERDASGAFAWTVDIRLPGPSETDNPAAGGFAFDGGYAYVALSRNNAVAVVNLASGTVEAQIPVGIAPYDVLRLGDKAYVTNWGGRRPQEGDVTGPTSGSRAVVDPETGIASTGTVTVLDLTARTATSEIAVGLHPCGMALSPDGSRLYVANANSHTVSVIDTGSDAVLDTLSAKPMDVLPFGSAPNALAISPDGSRLYVAIGGNNALAVIDLGSRKVVGLIPTGWYPGSVLLTNDATSLCVANTKGVGGRNASREHGLNSHDHMGSVSFIPVPTREKLTALTISAATSMRLPTILVNLGGDPGPQTVVPLPTKPGEKSVFKHVLYIIKENRTYDQVFGDMPQGNGDPSLTHFGREVTPNHHALAEQFVLLDNFYCNGVLSADGHQWTDEGYVTDYIEKSFGGFNRSYPYDGDDALAYASSGFLWDNVLRAGLTFRDYGEFVKARIEPSSATWQDIYRDYLDGTSNISIRATTELHTLEPYLCPTFVGFPGKVPDVYRARQFLNELAEFEAKGELPNFMIMLLPNDHTVGTREGYPTPRAAVADNDLALGMVVEAVSKSRFWKDTCIFVVEDDPQAGLDHVDGRRTVALCVSPYTKRGEVISTHYNQNSMVRSIELIFGLPPMSQLDMAANPMTDCFQAEPDLTPYTAAPNIIPLDELNPPAASLQGQARRDAEMSMALPLDDIDQADEQTFNAILWRSVKGVHAPYPILARRREVGPETWGTPASRRPIDLD